MRYLTRSFAVGALRRGKEIEQLLEAFGEDGRRGLRFAVILPATRVMGFRVLLFTVEDLEEPGERLIYHYPAFYEAEEDDDGGVRIVGEAETAEAVLDLAEQGIGAGPERWVNHGVLLDVYKDFVGRGRPLGRWKPV